MADNLSQQLEQLTGDIPKPRSLSDKEKDELVAHIGPRTVSSIVKAKSHFPISRIPFLFSTIDTQAVVDILGNDMTEAIKKAIAQNP